MRRARVFVSKQHAGYLIAEDDGRFVFEYAPGYDGPPVSLTMPVSQRRWEYAAFPPFFDGLLPWFFEVDGFDVDGRGCEVFTASPQSGTAIIAVQVTITFARWFIMSETGSCPAGHLAVSGAGRFCQRVDSSRTWSR